MLQSPKTPKTPKKKKRHNRKKSGKKSQQIKFRYQEIQKDDSDTEKQSNTAPRPAQANKKQQAKDIKGVKSLWKWYSEAPLKRISFLVFFLSIFIPFGFALYYFMDSDSSYLLSPIFALMISLYGLTHFHTLLGLHTEISGLNKNNRQFKKENSALMTSVNVLRKGHSDLKLAQKNLQETTKKLAATVEQLSTLEKDMQLITGDNKKGVKQIREHAAQMHKKFKGQLLLKERGFLFTIFDRFEMNDKTAGMTKPEFEEFIKLVPRGYEQRFKRLGTFRKLAKHDSRIDYDDFRSTLDLFAQMSVEDRDFDFKIEKLPINVMSQSQSLSVPEPMFRRQVSVTKKSAPGQYFKMTDINFDDDDDASTSDVDTDDDYNDNDDQ